MEVFVINFQEITKADKDIFDCFFKNHYYENSHFNFTNYFMWRKSFNIKYAKLADILFLKAKYEGEEFLLQPIGPKKRVQAAIGKCLQYCEENSIPFKMVGVEGWMAEELLKYDKNKFDFLPDRDNFDYVYLREDLAELKGRRYHSKKNHVNNFKKSYSDYEYRELTPDLVEQCKANLNNWFEQNDGFNDDIIMAEREAIFEVLDNFTDLKLTGGTILINGKVEAFTFGEQLNTDTAVIHVEKANPEIRGAYAIVNQEFCQKAWNHLKYINREEDMGVEGLRQAKKSYKPIKMIGKYIVTLK